MSWLHCVVSRAKTLSSLSTSSRRLAGSQAKKRSIVGRTAVTVRLPLPSCAALKPRAHSRWCTPRPIVTRPSAVPQRRVSRRGHRAAAQEAHHGVAGPLARQPHGARRVDRGHEVHEVLEALGLHQLLGARHAEHHQQRRDRQHGDHRQDVARAARRKHVGQHEREQRAEGRGNHEVRHEHQRVRTPRTARRPGTPRRRRRAAARRSSSTIQLACTPGLDEPRAVQHAARAPARRRSGRGRARGNRWKARR